MSTDKMSADKLCRWALALLLMLSPAISMGAADSRPLPQFEVTALDGQAVASDQLSPRDKWLLVYIEPGCEACENVLRVFKKEAPVADASQKVIVVLGGRSAMEAKWMAAKYSWLPSASWHADPTKRMASALNLKGAPMVLGIGRGKIEWSLAGALEPKKLEAILMTWCEG